MFAARGHWQLARRISMRAGRLDPRHATITAAGVIALVLSLGGAGLAQDVVPDYVGSDACADCHLDATEAWSGSHHAKAWTEPSAETVVADFDNTEFRHDGTITRFRESGGEYFIAITEKDGTTASYRVHSVAGIEPLQQYLLETEPGRLQSFDVVWDTQAERWYHLYPNQDLPPGDGLHWTGPYKNWNARCAECHATGFEKNYDPATRRYASVQAEIGVGCEACHGPAAAHLDWASGKMPDPSAAGLTQYGLTMDFGESVGTAVQQCATCHARREAHFDGNPLPGTPFNDAYALALLRPGQYHADGQILDEVYVYGSFLQSKMHARGVSCMDCHNAHGAELKAEANAVCTQCHSPAGNPSFPSLSLKSYDDPSHHFHAVGSDGALCKNCHMIERVYMGIDGRRDHSFRIPRPDLSVETASPNACTDCHTDRSASWASAAVAGWFPDSVHRAPHFGQTLAAGRRDPVAARDELVRLSAAPEQPGIVRATALWLMRHHSDAGLAERIVALLDDPDPLVRAAAVGLFQPLPASERADRLTPLLNDPSRTVRIETVKSLVTVPADAMPDGAAARLRAVAREWQQGLVNRADFPETHLILGGTALTMRNIDGARNAFREVVRMDPQREDAWVMLVRIAEATEGRRAAMRILDEALTVLPTSDRLDTMRSGSLLPPQ